MGTPTMAGRMTSSDLGLRPMPLPPFVCENPPFVGEVVERNELNEECEM